MSDLTTFTTFQNAFNKITFTTQRGFSRICGLSDFQGKKPFDKKVGEDCLTVPKKDIMEFLNSLQLNVTLKQSELSSPVLLEYQS